MARTLKYEDFKTAGSDVVLLVDKKRDDIKTYIVFGPQACGKTRNLEKIKRYFEGFRVVDNWVGDGLSYDTVYLTNMSLEELTQALADWQRPIGLMSFFDIEQYF